MPRRPTKVAIIHVQNAILQTKDGQKAAGELQGRFAPKKAELDKKQADIAALQDQLRKGSATMSEDAKAKLMRDIDANNKSLQRDTEDAQADLDAGTGQDHAGVGQQGDGGAREVRHRQRLRSGAGRQQSADSRSVGGFGHRYHHRHRQALRSGESGYGATTSAKPGAAGTAPAVTPSAGGPTPPPRLLRRRSNLRAESSLRPNLLFGGTMR